MRTQDVNNLFQANAVPLNNGVVFKLIDKQLLFGCVL